MAEGNDQVTSRELADVIAVQGGAPKISPEVVATVGGEVKVSHEELVAVVAVQAGVPGLAEKVQSDASPVGNAPNFKF